MYYEGGTPEGKAIEIWYWPVRGSNQQVRLETAQAANTDEGWVEVYIYTSSKRVLTSNGKIQTARLYLDYDVVDKKTSAVLYSVRQ